VPLAPHEYLHQQTVAFHLLPLGCASLLPPDGRLEHGAADAPAGASLATGTEENGG